MNIKIIKMSKEHIDSVVNLENECFSEPWSFEGILQELSNDKAYFIVAIMDNKVAGYTGMYCIYGDCYITNIAVSHNYRRLGIGKALINKLIKYAKKQNYNFISLEVRESNISAINLYKSFGFKKIGVRQNFYNKPKENAIIMTYNYSKKKREL